MNGAKRRRQVTSAVIALVVFAIVFAARAALVAWRGSPLPYLDSWEALFEHALVPWVEGTLGPGELFRPHFEHLVVGSKLIALLVAWLGGGTWHNVALLYVNAALYAGAVALVAWSIVPALAGAARPAFALALALLAGVPYGWANGLWELQNCWFLLVGLTALALRGALAVPRSADARIGFLASLALPFTLAIGGSSVAFALAARAYCAWKSNSEMRDRVRAVAPWAASTAFALGLMAIARLERPPSSSAPTPDAVAHALELLLSWPLPAMPIVAVAAFLPWLALLVTAIARPVGDRERQFLVMFGAWLLCVIVGLAAARSAELAVAVPQRYKELLALAAAVNVACLLTLATSWGRAGGGPRMLDPILGAWAIAVVTTVAVAGFNPEPIASRWQYQQQMRKNIRDYYDSGNPNALTKGGIVPFPYGSPARFAALLDRPGTKRLLAPIVSAP
jgi:hypothetical protein